MRYGGRGIGWKTYVRSVKSPFHPPMNLGLQAVSSMKQGVAMWLRKLTVIPQELVERHLLCFLGRCRTQENEEIMRSG